MIVSRNSLLLVFLLVAWCPGVSRAQEYTVRSIYYTSTIGGSDDSIFRADPAGSNPERIVFSIVPINHIIVDSVHNRLFWGAHGLWGSTLTGDDMQRLADPSTVSFTEPKSFALDPEFNHFYHVSIDRSAALVSLRSVSFGVTSIPAKK